MRRADSRQANWWYAVFSLTALLVVAVDQLSKRWIRLYTDGQPIFEAGFFRITHIQNTGAAFGLLQGHSFFLSIVDFIGIVLVLLFVFLVPRRFPLLDTKLAKLALGLILGGTVGNLIDRLRFGYVTDFISIGIWPAFNVADSALTVGVILLACSLFCSTRAKKPFPPSS